MTYLCTFVADVAQYLWAALPVDVCAVALAMAVALALLFSWRDHAE